MICFNSYLAKCTHVCGAFIRGSSNLKATCDLFLKALSGVQLAEHVQNEAALRNNHATELPCVAPSLAQMSDSEQQPCISWLLWACLTRA